MLFVVRNRATAGLLYIDGLTEAHSAADSDGRYGADALLQFAQTLAPTNARDALASVRDLLDTFGSGVDDDTTVLALNASRTTHEEQT